MNPIAQYPVFEENQVLTAKNLNDVVEFLNSQDLSSRRNLIGIGIVCGMHISSDLSTKVSISKGCGLTSMGHLIVVPDMDLPWYRDYTDAAEPPYDKFRKSKKKQYSLWELLTDEEVELVKEPDDIHKLNSSGAPGLHDKAVLVYLEIFDKDPDNCIAEDCDQMAISRRYNLRKLLIKKDDLLEIINKTLFGDESSEYLTPEELYETAHPSCALPAIATHRLNKDLSDLSSLNLAQINSWKKLRDAYTGVIEADAIPISKALYMSYEAYKRELSGQYPHGHPFPDFNKSEADENPLMELLSAEVAKQHDGLNIQYAYDFLDDLRRAYTEFSEVATEYAGQCVPDPDEFPLHLMLGLLNPDNEQENKAFRHHWQPSPAVSDGRDLLEEMRVLHFKMYVMVKHFQLRNFSSHGHIRITPGYFSGEAFSKHTAAHYYMREEEPEKLVTHFWNYKLKKQCKEDTVLSYFPQLYSTKDFVRNPLQYSLRDYDYFRIEGHIGQEYKGVKELLEEKVVQHNLPFDILGIKLGSDQLDVEVPDHCFEDLQAIYKVNRDEYLACILAIYNPIKGFVDSILALDEEKRKALLATSLPDGLQVSFIDTYGDLFLILQLYAFFLKNTIDLLPESIRDFDLVKFEPENYKVLAFSLIMSIVLEFLTNNLSNFGSFTALTVLKTFFDRLIDDCTGAKFKSIYELYQERLLKTQFGRLFPGYVKGSPGMEHIAGVKEGGTFILVYDEMPEFQVFIPPVQIPGFIPLDPCFEDERAQSMQLQILQYAYVMHSAPDLYMQYQPFIDPEAGVSGEELKKKVEDGQKVDGGGTYLHMNFDASLYQTQVNHLPPRYQTTAGLLQALFPGIGKDESRKQKVYRVVADFAVPYRCCKDCLKAEKPEPPPDMSIAIVDGITQFCHKDGKDYRLIVEPAVEEGVVSSTSGGVSQDDDGTWRFRPAKVDWKQEEITLTYTIGEDQVEMTVMVYNPIAKAVAKVDYERQTITLENHSENADEYTWEIPELEYTHTTTKLEPLTFKFSQVTVEKITPSLTARRKDLCGDTHTLAPIVIQQAQDPFIDLEKTEGRDDYLYFFGDNKMYPFTLLPPGGKFEGKEGSFIKEGDKYFFKPSIVKEGDYTFSYMETAKLTATVVYYRLLANDGSIKGVVVAGENEAGISKLRGTGYESDKTISAYHTKLADNLKTDEEARKKFYSGGMNRAISLTYSRSVNESLQALDEAMERGDKWSVKYLTKTYIGTLEQLAVVLESTGSTISLSSGIIKIPASAFRNLKKLKDDGININPDGELKAMLKRIDQLYLRKEIKAKYSDLEKLI